MSKTTNLPAIKNSGNSASPLLAVNNIIKSVPSVVNSVSVIVSSCNNKTVRQCEINAHANIANNKIEKDYLLKCKQLEIKSDCMKTAFESKKISGAQIVELVKELTK